MEKRRRRKVKDIGWEEKRKKGHVSQKGKTIRERGRRKEEIKGEENERKQKIKRK